MRANIWKVRWGMLRSIIASSLLFGSHALAQGPVSPLQTPMGPPARPAFSPYLNLARFGASPALNYYGLVRPQMQLSSSVQALQSQALAPSTQDFLAEQAITTGNAFGYQNYQSYFQNQYSFNGSGGFGTNRGANGQRGTTGIGGSMLPQSGSGRPNPPRR